MTEDLRRWIRDIPDFPKQGIVFKDITPLVQNGRAFREALDGLWRPYAREGVEAIVGAEARGFIFGAALAAQQGLPFVPVRKPGKLPYKTHRINYSLEYGEDALEIHIDGVAPGQKVLLVDDLLATGGTMKAAADLVGRCGAKVVGCAFVIELAFLPGRAKLAPHRVTSLIAYDAE